MLQSMGSQRVKHNLLMNNNNMNGGKGHRYSFYSTHQGLSRAEGTHVLSRGNGAFHWLRPVHGAKAQRSRASRTEEKDRERESTPGSWQPGHTSCPLVYPVQPLLKIELYFAERFSNDTHQVPINSSEW